MRSKFVKASNVKRLLSGVSALEKRGALEACIMVVDGVPGLGKTRSIRNFVVETGSLYVRAKTEQSANWLLGEMLRELDETPPHSRERKYDKLAEALARESHKAQLEGRSFALVVDEGDAISRNGKLLETIRDLSDDTEVPTIIVGMRTINDNLKRFPAFSSRVSQRVTFQPATLEDVRLLFAELCEVSVGDDVCKYIHKFSGGYNREVVDAIAKVERVAKRLEINGDAIALSDLSGHAIMQDRNTSKPITVPEVI